MRDDPEFNKYFISVMKKYEILYNHTLDDYSDKNLKEKAWAEVGREVGFSVENCKKRWRTFRLSLVRYVRESTLCKGRKSYYLSDDLKFLVPFIKFGQATINKKFLRTSGYLKTEYNSDEETVNTTEYMEATDNNNLEENDYKEIADNPEIEQNLNNDLDDINFQSTSMNENEFIQHLSDDNKNWRNVAIRSLQILNEKHTLEEDSDLLFFKSLLPDIKKLSDAQKRKFKRKIFVLFDDVLNESPS